MGTVLHRLAVWAESEPRSLGQKYREGSEWKSIAVRDYCDRVYWLALFLESRGMGPQDVGTILSYNSPSWVHMDLAAMLMGAKSAGIYPNSTQKDILYILNHTDSRFLSVQNKEYFQKIVRPGTDDRLPEKIELIVVFDGDTSISPLAVSYEAALAIGKGLATLKGAKKLQNYLDAIDPHAGALMIYTSGTTGTPKGALLSHDNLMYTTDRGLAHWGLVAGNGSLFSFLPLCHIAEKIQNLGGISLRYTVNFCSQFDQVAVELPMVQPTLLLCVPRLWEKMMEGVMHKIDTAPTARKLLAKWAFAVGQKTASIKYAGKTLSPSERVQWAIADKLVLSKIRQALGLAQANALASGAAMLPAHVSRWFHALGLEIMEVFGQTESTGIIFMTDRGKDQAGTAGRPVRGMEFKLAADGEILARGRNVFKGYFKNDQATAQTIDSEGWLQTGDLGELDSQGLVRIRGRKKEILKTSGGKMVAPLPIEEALKAAPIISQVCMVGEGRKYLAVLVTLSESKMAALTQAHGRLADGVITFPDVVQAVASHIEKLNVSLASYEQIKKFAILSQEFSIERGELTPTLKMKRNVIETHYQEIINSFYE